jgi:hypothetical protein
LHAVSLLVSVVQNLNKGFKVWYGIILGRMQLQMTLHGQKLTYGKGIQESHEITHIKYLIECKMTVFN